MNYLTLVKEGLELEHYDDFTTGVKIGDTQVKKWVVDCIDTAMEKISKDSDIEDSFCTIASGNTKILVEIYRQHNNKTLFTIFINIITNYKQKNFINVKL